MMAAPTETGRARLLPLAGLVAALAALHALGRGRLEAPPLGSASLLWRWAVEQEPATVALVAVRMLAIAVGYHLAATTLLAVVGRLVRAPRLVAAADAMTLPMFRSAAGRVAGLIMSASTVVGGALPSAGAAPVSPGVRSAVVVDASGIAPAHGTIERIALPAGPATASPTDSTSATIRPVVPAPSAAVPITPPAPTLHLVRQGDHLWRIAEAALASSWGRPATDQEVDPFWRQVIAANPDVVDPDLIFPGQHVVVPPTPPPPA